MKSRGSGTTPLHHAAYSGSLECCQLLLDFGASLNERDEQQRTPLHHATARGALGCIGFLLDKGADVNASDEDQVTALHLAAGQGNTSAVNKLLRCQADVNLQDKLGRTPAHLASLFANPITATNILGALIERSANIYMRDKDGLTPLHVAASTGNDSVLSYLMGNRRRAPGCPQDVNPSELRDNNGLLLLHFVALSGNPECLKYWLEEDPDADINARDGLGQSALHYAAFKGNLECVELLLKRGANPNLASEPEKSTPLHKACFTGNLQCVDALLEAGAVLDALDAEGATPSHKAIFSGHTQLVRILQRSKNVDLNTVDGSDLTSLHMAAANGHSGLLNILLLSGTQWNLNAIDAAGSAPLHYATLRGDPTTVKILLDRGGDQRIADSHGDCPIHIAARRGLYEVLEILTDHANSVDVNAANAEGKVPLQLALLAGSSEAVKTLLQRNAAITDDMEALFASDQIDIQGMSEDLPAASMHRLKDMPALAEKLADVLILDDNEDLGPVPDLETFDIEQSKQAVFEEGLALFNSRPHKGVAFWFSNQVIPRNPKSVARLLFVLADRFNLEMVGEYLGSDSKFEGSVRRYFAHFIQLRGIEFDTGLRRFLQKFGLPREAQKIDRLLQAFAERYYFANADDVEIRGLCTSALATHRLAFATLMLNTDAHNENVKKEKKMTLPQFLDNIMPNLEIREDNTSAIEQLTDLYWRIVQNALGIRDTQFSNVEKSAWLHIKLGRAWKRRWFVLHDTSLTYLKSPGALPIGSFDLKLYTAKLHQPTSKKHRSFFLILLEHGANSVVIRTETQRDQEAWINALIQVGSRAEESKI
ncbi:MAG: ankyrin repeat domain-containing protein [Mycobacteriaceae bacterium]|nr:ankyrin repeat domain-containing protein [Mycobacteriaceae bacterium]